MESEKKPYGFIIFTNDLDKTARLSDADFRQWVTACVVYANSGEVIDIPDMAAICFDFVRGRIDDYKNKYEKQAETSRENGRKGGRPPKPKETYENPAGFSETQQNHKYRLIDKRTEHIDQNIKKHALSEEVMEEIEEGSGEGKEEPLPSTMATVFQPDEPSLSNPGRFDYPVQEAHVTADTLDQPLPSDAGRSSSFRIREPYSPPSYEEGSRLKDEAFAKLSAYMPKGGQT